MERHSMWAAAAGLVLLWWNLSAVWGQSNPSSDEGRRRYAPSVSVDYGGWLPMPPAGAGESSPFSDAEEALFATYSFSDLGRLYHLEFYYRNLYGRLRIRAWAGDEELHGLLNRFYSVDTRGRYMISVTRTQDGSPAFGLNFGGLVLKESSLNTDAVYDALEAFLSTTFPQEKNPRIYMNEPPGLLEKTCWTRIFAGSHVGNYLINEAGQVEPLTLESLRVAYDAEGIVARGPEDFERIARSLITAEHKISSRYEIAIIAAVEEIPGYSAHPLDAAGEASVQAPRFYQSADGQTDYWECCTYRGYHGVVARYTFGFRGGRLESAEKSIVGQDIGRASYLAGEGRRVTTLSPAGSVRGLEGRTGRRSSFSPLCMVSIAVGILLLLAGGAVRARRSAARRRAQSLPPVDRHQDGQPVTDGSHP